MDEDILIITEENIEEEKEIRKKYDWVWLVDPLDGTKEFVNCCDDFTINIGLTYKMIIYFFVKDLV